MALLTRELELIIIARDHTQSTTARVAGAMTFIGAAIVTMGVTWAKTLGDMTSDAIDFRNDAALAFTQMFEVGDASIDDIQEAMLRVGREVPVPFDEMAEAMFDIFSSIEATVPEAEVILREVSKAAVAGQTDVRSAMVPTIAMMNAFGLTAEDMEFILDQQFTTVQRGILTYGDFTQTIGKVIPAAKASGQTIETMGATVAFLTKNGLSAAMAGTSAARAFELFANPKTVKNLEDAGIAVRDSRGEFRQINDVLADMDSIFGGLTAPERKEKFIEIFGQGRIQARRFFDIAIPNWEEFNTLVETFTSEKTLGAMQKAYDIMMDQPRQKIDLLKNRFHALRLEIGGKFIPMLLDVFLPIADRILDWWESLDDAMKTNIAKWAGWGAVATIAIGAFITILGVGKLIAAVFGVKGIAGVITAIGVPMLKFLGWIGLIASIAIFVWKNWDKIIELWETRLLPAIKAVVEFLRPFVEDIVQTGTEAWGKFTDFLQEKWEILVDLLKGVITEEFLERFQNLPDELRSIWDRVVDIVGPAVELIKAIIEQGLAFIALNIEMFVTAFVWIWENWGDEIMAVIRFAWVFIATFIEIALSNIRGAIEFLTAIITGDWQGAWDAIKNTFLRTWDIIMEKTANVRATIVQWFQDMGAKIAEIWHNIWTGVKDFFFGIWRGILDFFIAFGEEASELFTTVWTGISDFFVGIWEGLLDFIAAVGETASNIFTTAWTAIKDFFVNLWNGIVEFFVNLWNNEIVQFIVDILGIFYEIYRIGLELIVEIWKLVWTAISDFFVEIWNKIVAYFGPILETILDIATTIWTSVRDFFLNTLEAIKTKFTEIWDAVSLKVEQVWNIIKTTAETVWGAVRDFFLTTLETIKTRFSIIWNGIKSTIIGVWNDIRGNALRIWNGIKENVLTAIRVVLLILGGWWESIKNTATRLWNILKWNALGIWNTIKNNILNPMRQAKDGVSTFVGNIIGFIVNLWNRATYWVGRIRDVLKKISPAEWFSLPITQTVAAGFRTLQGVMTGALAGIEQDAITRVGRIRSEVTELQRLRQEQFLLINNPIGTGTTQENTFNITSTSSPAMIADEISWSIKII